MPSYKYSIITDPDRSAKASARDIDISPKAAREILRAIKGMKIDQCKEYLEDVIAKKRSVPYRRYKRNVGHKSDLKGWAAGRYPVKAAKEILKVVENLENNVEANQLQVDKAKIIHAVSLKGSKEVRYFYRAHGRSTPKVRQYVHIELVAEIED